MIYSKFLASWSGQGLREIFSESDGALQALSFDIVGLGGWPFESGPLSLNGVLARETDSDIIDADCSLLAGSGAMTDDGDVSIAGRLKTCLKGIV